MAIRVILYVEFRLDRVPSRGKVPWGIYPADYGMCMSNGMIDYSPTDDSAPLWVYCLFIGKFRRVMKWTQQWAHTDQPNRNHRSTERSIGYSLSRSLTSRVGLDEMASKVLYRRPSGRFSSNPCPFAYLPSHLHKFWHTTIFQKVLYDSTGCAVRRTTNMGLQNCQRCSYWHHRWPDVSSIYRDDKVSKLF